MDDGCVSGTKAAVKDRAQGDVMPACLPARLAWTERGSGNQTLNVVACCVPRLTTVVRCQIYCMEREKSQSIVLFFFVVGTFPQLSMWKRRKGAECYGPSPCG